MPYRFLEDVATADIAFEAWGKELEGTFQSAAEATMNVMLEDLEAIRFEEKRTFSLKNEDLDMLLFDFLQELIYYKDAEKLMLRVPHLVIKGEKPYILEAVAMGEKLDPVRHQTRVDVKAVTLHRFKLEKVGDEWKACVILDI